MASDSFGLPRISIFNDEALRVAHCISKSMPCIRFKSRPFVSLGKSLKIAIARLEASCSNQWVVQYSSSFARTIVFLNAFRIFLNEAPFLSKSCPICADRILAANLAFMTSASADLLTPISLIFKISISSLVLAYESSTIDCSSASNFPSTTFIDEV